MSEDSDEMLDVLPVQWRVVRTVWPKYSCRACDKIVQAPAPPKAIARGKASFATLAHVVVNKFDHHLPLYRQAEMMAAPKGCGGIDIDRSTLAGWAGQAAALLDPIVARIREEGLKATKVHTDDTPVPMLDPGRGKTATARLWTYVVDGAPGSASPAPVWYRFTPDRSGIHPQTELKSFTGLLQADGVACPRAGQRPGPGAGYDKLYDGGRICEVACWAHFRRKIFENHATSPTLLTTDCSNGSHSFTPARPRFASNRPMPAANTGKTIANRWLRTCASPSTMRCATFRPSRRCSRRSPMAASAGRR